MPILASVRLLSLNGDESRGAPLERQRGGGRWRQCEFGGRSRLIVIKREVGEEVSPDRNGPHMPKIVPSPAGAPVLRDEVGANSSFSPLRGFHIGGGVGGDSAPPLWHHGKP